MEETSYEILIKKGYSKYKIAKLLGCAYNTVYMWHRGVWKPSTKNQIKLDKIMEEAKNETTSSQESQ